MFVIGEGMMLKLMSEYNYHSGIRLRIYPSYQQKRIIKKNAETARFIYNEMIACSKEIAGFGKLAIYIQGITERIQVLRERIKSVTSLKSHFLWMDDVDLDANMIANAKKNYAHAWKCYRCGEVKNPPAFHRRTYALSYQTNPHYNRQRVLEAGLTNGSAGFRDTSHVFVPKLGLIRYKGSRKILARIFSMRSVRIGTMTVTRDACGDYFLSMQLASDESFAASIPKAVSVVGIDLNIKNLYVDSNGCRVDRPGFLQKVKKRLTHAQRILSRRARGCKQRRIPFCNGVRYQRQRRIVAKLKRQIKRQREDFLHVQSMGLIKNHEIIVAEQLDIRKLVRLCRCAREIYEMGWRTFLDLLEYKAKRHGRVFLKVNPAYTTQRCSACGYTLPIGQRLHLSDRQWQCPSCHVIHDRDRNAACNILHRGLACLSK